MATSKQRIAQKRNWGCFRLVGAIGIVSTLRNLAYLIPDKSNRARFEQNIENAAEYVEVARLYFKKKETKNGND